MYFGLIPNNSGGTLVNYTFSYIRKKFYKKMSIKNSKTLENVKKNFQAQMPELQFLKMLIFHRALFKSQN